MHTQRDQRLQQRVDLARKHAFHRLQRRAGASARARGDQVGDGFGLRQVELAVEKRPLGEFARPRQPRAQLARAAQQQIEQYRAAMPLQFQHMFAGVRGGRGKIQQQAAIDQLAFGIMKGGEMRMPRRRRSTEQRLRHRRRGRSGHPHHAHARCAGRAGDGGDGLAGRIERLIGRGSGCHRFAL